MKRHLLLAMLVLNNGCAAFDKNATDADVATAEAQIEGIGNTVGAALPPPWGFAAAGATAIVLLAARLMRGKKPAAPA